MKLSLFGRWSMALFASLALGLGMTACGGGTIGYMWVLGQQYNNVAGFKIDDYTGNLTQIINSPFASNGANPVSIVIKPGGRYVYVINQGTCPATGCGTAANIGQSIALFSVGGDGTLNYQQSYFTQGYYSMWAQLDPTGSYLYVLDKYAPVTLGSPAATYGVISAFTSDPNTGRLATITNNQNCGPSTCPTVFNVGSSPFMMKTAGSCLFTVNSADNSITPYQLIGGGQLSPAGVGGKFFISVSGVVPQQITSITSNGSNIYLTDGPGDVIYQFGASSSCSFTNGLTTTQGPGGQYFATATYPAWTLVDSTGKYLYVLNQKSTITTPGTPYSTITAYTINSNTQNLQPIAGGLYSVGSNPICMSEDPTNQYMYISNNLDGTITGKVIDPNTGELSPLSRGSTFNATGKLGCLAISGAIN
jgi:6-phosphogluconolactonase (cycloisomerase 2 family)